MKFFQNTGFKLILIMFFIFLNGFDLKVRIFSNQKIKELKILSDCFFIDGKSDESDVIRVIYLNGVLRILSNKDIYEGSKFNISFCNDKFSVQVGSFKRLYYGKLILYLKNKSIIAVNEIDLENYLISVLENETSSMKNIEAIKANAVVSRTYVVASLNRRHPNEEYNFCDLTHCQLYRGFNKIRDIVIKAVEQTKGYIVYYKGKPPWTMYHSVCGGKTEDAFDIWGYDTMPYLKSVNDEINGHKLCSYAWGYRWRTKISKKRMDKFFHDLKILKNNEKIIDLFVDEVSVSGRVKKIAIKTDKRILYLRGIDFYHLFGRNVNWLAIKSTNFQIKKDKKYFIFEGHGYGHGAGMCQAGAEKMGELGYSWKEILRHYYYNVDIIKSDF